jgi:hypothetical protein
MFALPLQVIDKFLIQYNIGQVLVLVFVLGFLGTIPLRSKTISGAHVAIFGLLFVMTPLSLMGNDIIYRLIGIGLIFIGPMIVVVGE